ncbi:MAG: phosphatidylglycerol lysyltransferase domain-containing protein, partial [Armatimonadetes bacterium]|nr:phosphatidylglycerol lysyltransferase domain-containing protein [Armatimonadota bacterium]
GLGGGAALVGLLAADAPPNRVAPWRTVAAMTLVYALDYGVFAILAVATLVALAAARALTRGEAVAVMTLTGIVVCVAAALALALRLRPRASGRLLRLLHFTAAMARRRPRVLVGSVAGCLVREAGDAFALVAARRAFGVQAPALMIAAMYVISGAVALVSFVPQGIGVVEASVTILLRGLGVPPGASLAACLLFRGVSFWLPIPLGMAAGAAIRRDAAASSGTDRPAPPMRPEFGGARALGVRIAAVLAAAVGIVNLVSALLPRVPWRGRLVAEALPVHVMHAGRTLVVFLGFALIYFAAQLWRRKRRAWQLVMWMLAVSLVMHLVKGFDYEEATICLLGMASLWKLRDQYRAGHDPASLRQSLAVIGFAAAAVAVYGLAGFALMRGEFGGRVGSGEDRVRAAWTWFFLFDDQNVVPLTRHARWFVESLDTLGMAAIGAALLVLSKPWKRIQAATETERRDVQQALSQHARTDLAHFCLLPDKAYFWNAERSGVLAYKLVGNVALVLGDPAAPDAEVRPLVAAFMEHCLVNDWRPAFYQVTPAFAAIAAEAGLQLLKVGEDALLDLRTFTLEGSHAKAFRQTVSALERQGVTMERYDLTADPRDIAHDLRRISDAWLRSRKGSEKTFSLGYFDTDLMKGYPLMVAFGADGRPVAFENLVPMYAANGYAGDMNRCLPDAPKRIQEYLIIKTALWLKERGHEWYGQGLAPLATMGDPTPGVPPAAERAIGLLYRHFNVFYGFLGLRAFKQKFHPVWESRYLAYPGAGLLPKVVTAVIRADSKGSLLDFLRP